MIGSLDKNWIINSHVAPLHHQIFTSKQAWLLGGNGFMVGALSPKQL